MCEMCDSLTVPAPEFVTCVSTVLLQSLDMTESDESLDMMESECATQSCVEFVTHEYVKFVTHLCKSVTSYDRVRVCDSFMRTVRD